mgnify:CR=1 FL=1
MTAPAELTDIAYSTDGPIAWITPLETRIALSCNKAGEDGVKGSIRKAISIMIGEAC